MTNTTKIIQGSWKRGIVGSCIQEERDKKDFTGSLHEIGNSMMMTKYLEALDFMESHPDLKNNHKFYEWSREEMLDNWYKKVNVAYRLGKEQFFVNHNPSLLTWAVTHLGENPLGLNQTMF